MTNIMPQIDKMNRGAWLWTEMLVECFRDVEDLNVIGGAVFPVSGSTGETAEYEDRLDWFRESHNVDNPSFFWKVIQAKTLFPRDYNRIAFFMPNDVEATARNTGAYIVSLETLEAKLAAFGQPETFDVPAAQKRHVPSVVWDIPKGCNRG